MRTVIFNAALLIALILPITVCGETFEKEINKSFNADSNTKLRINHQYGELKLIKNKENKIIVNAKIIVDKSEDVNYESALKRFNVDINHTGNIVYVTTTINNDNSKGGRNRYFNVINSNFKINIDIYLPECANNAEITHKYGNLIIPDYSGELDISLRYGTFFAENLTNKNSIIKLQYCQNSTIESVTDIGLELRYSGLTVKNASSIKINNNYSTLKADNIKTLDGKFSYGGLSVKQIEQLNIESRYSTIEAETLLKQGIFETRYGNVTINSLSADFKELRFDSQYTMISIDTQNNKNYDINIEGNYTSINIHRTTQTKTNGNYTTVIINEGHISKIKANLRYGAFTVK